MPGRWSTVLIVIFWCTTMALLVRQEVLPRWRATEVPRPVVPDVRSLIAEGPSHWMIYRSGKAVGRARMWWELAPEGAVSRAVVVLWQSPLVTLFGKLQTHEPLTVRSATYVTDDGELIRFDTELLLAHRTLLASVDGVRRGDRLDVTVRVDRFRQRLSFYYDSTAVWSSGLVPMDRLSRLRPGMSWSWKVVDPIRGTPGLVRCRVVGARQVPWAGQSLRAYIVEQDYGGMKTRSLVALDGTILRQEVPFGWATYTVVRLPRQARYRDAWIPNGVSGR